MALFMYSLLHVWFNPLPTNDAYHELHKPISIYMGGGLILGVNTLYSFFKLFPMVGKGLSNTILIILSAGQ